MGQLYIWSSEQHDGTKGPMRANYPEKLNFRNVYLSRILNAQARGLGHVDYT